MVLWQSIGCSDLILVWVKEGAVGFVDATTRSTWGLGFEIFLEMRDSLPVLTVEEDNYESRELFES